VLFNHFLLFNCLTIISEPTNVLKTCLNVILCKASEHQLLHGFVLPQLPFLSQLKFTPSQP